MFHMLGPNQMRMHIQKNVHPANAASVGASTQTHFPPGWEQDAFLYMSETIGHPDTRPPLITKMARKVAMSKVMQSGPSTPIASADTILFPRDICRFGGRSGQFSGPRAPEAVAGLAKV